MRRILLLTTLLAIVPSVARAQPRLMFGGGFTAPQGDVGSFADPGWHVAAALSLGIPTLPVGLRGDGRLHKMGSSDAAYRNSEFLAGSVSLVFALPGVGLEPYVLAGMGSYRFKGGLEATEQVVESNTGYHGGFGVALGQLGFGLFAEIRYVYIDLPDGSNAMIPLTLGFRL